MRVLNVGVLGFGTPGGGRYSLGGAGGSWMPSLTGDGGVAVAVGGVGGVEAGGVEVGGVEVGGVEVGGVEVEGVEVGGVDVVVEHHLMFLEASALRAPTRSKGLVKAIVDKDISRCAML